MARSMRQVRGKSPKAIQVSNASPVINARQDFKTVKASHTIETVKASNVLDT